ncbi:hypothetical protein AAP_00589 [Ascosphaera apis ARSEF 7405]|uniref:Transmembrane protein n=1 Tax=Ascosphaera apis ARSEF 7405 TaxID=392613 RepID=A0A168CS60_9EURO|nr:hypothetical protein AAP_00589 [Ascosphaera apis ARSEF 7405]
MASARLRKAFHYPESDDEGNGRNELDEEEQEKIIAKLREEDEKHNRMYKKAFTALPSVAVLLYVPEIMSESSTTRFCICLLCMLSLLMVSWTTYQQPLRKSDRKGKRPMRLVEEENASSRQFSRLANAVLAAAIALIGFRSRGDDSTDFFWLYCIIPGACYTAERSMGSVDLDELENLKYDLKGA